MTVRLLASAFLAMSLGLSLAWCAEPSGEAGEVSAETTAATPEENRVTLAVARDRAKLMENIYSTTLEVLHDRYFHGDRAIVPARAMEDVFDTMDQQLSIRSRWISVNTKAMSITHEPKTALDKKAAAELATGKAAFELIENGQYYRATPIPLGSGCISCHDGFFRTPSKAAKFAGLIVTIPLKQE